MMFSSPDDPDDLPSAVLSYLRFGGPLRRGAERPTPERSEKLMSVIPNERARGNKDYSLRNGGAQL